MNIAIDNDAGFCFGVKKAVGNAETYLHSHDKLFCLGDIVHNEVEVDRLRKLGLIIINREQFHTLKNETVLIRAHGEPGETYETAIRNNIKLIDATCPLVLRLQKTVKEAGRCSEQKPQIIIYGKSTHPEVVALKSQAPEQVIVVNENGDLNQVDFTKPIKLFSQTTKDKNKLFELKHEIQKRIKHAAGPGLEFNDTICKQVHNRNDSLKAFCSKHQVVIFVGGLRSSNARVLYDICKSSNQRSYFVSNEQEVQSDWLKNTDSVGISGATSTPLWLLEKVKQRIQTMLPID